MFDSVQEDPLAAKIQFNSLLLFEVYFQFPNNNNLKNKSVCFIYWYSGSFSLQNFLGVRNLCRLAAVFFFTIVTVVVFAHSECGIDQTFTLLSVTTTMKEYFSQKAEASSRGRWWNASAPLLLRTFMTASLSLDQHHPHIFTRYVRDSVSWTPHTGALGPVPQLNHLPCPSFLWKRSVTHWCVRRTSPKRIHANSFFFGRPELPEYESGGHCCGDRPLLESSGTILLDRIPPTCCYWKRKHCISKRKKKYQQPMSSNSRNAALPFLKTWLSFNEWIIL